MDDAIIRIVDVEAFSRERRIEQEAVRRGYLTGIVDAIRLTRRALDNEREYHKQDSLRELLTELERVREGQTVR